MTIRQKIFYFGVISLVAALALGFIGFLGQQRLAAALSDNQITASALRNHLEGDMMHDALNSDVLAALLAATHGDSSTHDAIRRDFQEHSEWFRRVLTANTQLDLSPDIKQALSNSKTALDRYIESAGQIIDLAFTDLNQARAQMAGFSASFTELEEKNEALSEKIEAAVEEANAEAQQRVSNSFWLLLVSAGVVLVALWLINQRLSHAILHPIEQTMLIAQAMSQGDLRQKIVVANDDETGQLQRAFAMMQQNLYTMIDEMKHEADQLRQTAQELSQTAHTVVDSATNQSDNAATIASAMEQMIRNIDQIASHAQNARSIAHESESSAAQGGEVIMGVVEGMNSVASAVNASSSTIAELGRSSEEIYSIIQVIRSIADQTNLLALNAAIEAARAGDAGRGFAVVADEVRNLAARTAQSTQEITDMIGRIQGNTRDAVNSMEKGVNSVQLGVDRAQQAGASIDSIRSGAKRAAMVVEEISGNINEQSNASNEIARRVEQIADMSRHSSDSVRLLADASQRLSQIAAQMQRAVARFQV